MKQESYEAYKKRIQDELNNLETQDRQNRGTSNYQGYAKFWGGRYDRQFKEATREQKIEVHGLLLKAGLPMLTWSKEHDKIIFPYFGLTYKDNGAGYIGTWVKK